MPTPFKDRAVLNVLDLGKQPQTRAVLVCSGDDGAIAPFMVGVDRLSYGEEGEFIEGYRENEPLPVVRLSSHCKFVVFDRSILEVLTFADRAKLSVDDDREKEALLREHDPETATMLDARKRQMAVLEGQLRSGGSEDVRPAGQYL